MCVVMIYVWINVFFFFKQKTAYEMRISDWSSDVCSSDLLQHLGPLRGHLQHFFVGDSIQLAGLGNDTRIGGVDAIDIGIDVTALGLQRGGQRHRRSVGAATAEGGDAAGRIDALEAGDPDRKSTRLNSGH